MTTNKFVEAPGRRGVPDIQRLSASTDPLRFAAIPNLLLRLCVELAAYSALAYWGASTSGSAAEHVALAVLLPLSAMALWLLLLAPRARWHLREPAAFLLEFAIFAGSASALATSGQRLVGALFGAIAVVNAVLVRLFERRFHLEKPEQK